MCFESLATALCGGTLSYRSSCRSILVSIYENTDTSARRSLCKSIRDLYMDTRILLHEER